MRKNSTQRHARSISLSHTPTCSPAASQSSSVVKKPFGASLGSKMKQAFSQSSKPSTSTCSLSSAVSLESPFFSSNSTPSNLPTYFDQITENVTKIVKDMRDRCVWLFHKVCEDTPLCLMDASCFTPCCTDQNASPYELVDGITHIYSVKKQDSNPFFTEKPKVYSFVAASENDDVASNCDPTQWEQRSNEPFNEYITRVANVCDARYAKQLASGRFPNFLSEELSRAQTCPNPSSLHLNKATSILSWSELDAKSQHKYSRNASFPPRAVSCHHTVTS